MSMAAPTTRDHDAELSQAIERLKPVDATVESTVSTPRERIATAALSGLLAATPAAMQHTTSVDAYAKRAVRYADALLGALNHSTAEAMTNERSR